MMHIMLMISLFFSISQIYSVDDLGHQLLRLRTDLKTLSTKLNQLSGVSTPVPAQSTATQVSAITSVNRLIQIPWLSSNPKFNIYQVPVLQQVAAADCGYHAKKNALFMLNAIISTGTDQQFFLQALIDKVIYRTAHEEWSKAIAEKRRGGDTDWLLGNEMEYLQEEVPFTKALNSNLDEHYFTVIDNIEWLTKHEGRGVTAKMIKTIENFRKQPNFSHEILLADSREYVHDQHIQTTRSHWVALIINKVDNKIQYLLMDSLNNPKRIDADYIINLINVLEKKNLTQYKIEASEIGNLMSTIHILSNQLWDENIPEQTRLTTARSLLEKVNRIIVIAEDEGLLHTREFESNKTELINALEAVKLLFEHQLSESGEIDLLEGAKAALQIRIS